MQRNLTALLLADCRVSPFLQTYFADTAIRVVSIAAHPSLPVPTASHPDMQFFCLGDTVFTVRNNSTAHRDAVAQIREMGYRVFFVTSDPGREYPQDILLNCTAIGDFLFCNRKYTAPEILQTAEEKGMTVISVRQGYAGCSVCRLDDTAIITADAGIATAAEGCGIEVLRIRQGGIKLTGYPYGFIGGASGSMDDCVYLMGKLSSHPDGESIRAFCVKHKKTVCELGDTPFIDVGKLIFLKQI